MAPNIQAKSLRVCVPQTDVVSKGIWFNDNPLDYPLPAAMAQIILAVVTSRLLYFLLRPLGQTKFVCNLLGGIILGRSGLGRNQIIKDKMFHDKDAPLLGTMALLGTIYSMFLVAVKFDINMVKRTKLAWRIGVPVLIFTVAATLSLGYPLASTIPGFNGGMFFPIFCFSFVSFTFFPVIAQALDELNLMNSELGQIAMSSALITELIQWVFSAVQNIVTKKSVTQGGLTFIAFVAMTVFTAYAIRPLMLSITKNTPEGQEVKECYVAAILVGVLVMAFVFDAIGCSSMLGAIILGLVIPDGPPLGAALISKSEFLVSELFLPVFYFRVGFRTNVFSISDWNSFNKLQIVIVVSYVAKMVAVTVAALCCKIRLRNSLLLGMMMNIRGIIEMVVFAQWRYYELLDEQVYTQLVLSVLTVTMIATSSVHFLYSPQQRLGTSTKGSHIRNIQSVQTNSPFCILCCVHNEESIRSITSLIEASNPTEANPIFAYIIQAVELVGRAAPLLVPYKKKEGKKFSRINTLTHQMMQAFLNYSESSRGLVLIKSYTMIAPYKSMHETIVRLVDDKFIHLVIVPFHENHNVMIGYNVTAAIRQFNINVQEYSPCTVGILVERGLSGRLSLSHFSYNVAAFFIGGPDDREALALAARMSGNQNVVVTVYRLILRKKLNEGRNYNEEEEREARLDESMVDEFKMSNIGNDCLNWRDMEVEDSVELMDAIINSQGDYDLVMVGRRHADKSLRDDEEMSSEFVHYAELGMIGDLLASPDFCGGMVNVLVLQESRELSGTYGSSFHSDSSQHLGNRF